MWNLWRKCEKRWRKKIYYCFSILNFETQMRSGNLKGLLKIERGWSADWPDLKHHCTLRRPGRPASVLLYAYEWYIPVTISEQTMLVERWFGGPRLWKWSVHASDYFAVSYFLLQLLGNEIKVWTLQAHAMHKYLSYSIFSYYATSENQILMQWQIQSVDWYSLYMRHGTCTQKDKYDMVLFGKHILDIYWVFTRCIPGVLNQKVYACSLWPAIYELKIWRIPPG